MFHITTLVSIVIGLIDRTKLDPPLPSYSIDVGRTPTWSAKTAEELQVTRWAIDINTAKCVSFVYKGSGGNFNNFPTKQACEEHKIFKPIEQVAACLLPPAEGECAGVPQDNRVERWYFSSDGNSLGSTEVAPNTCASLIYTGCGGNANNFISQLDCRKACQNSISGVAPEEDNQDKANEIFSPNEFDCRFYEPPDSDEPIVRVVADMPNKKCIFAATSASNVNRGYFSSLSQCVSICFESSLIEACSKSSPDQFDLPDDPDFTTITVGVKYYFDITSNICKQFETYTPHNDQFSKDKNRFDSVELCSSFCPAVSQPSIIKTSLPCREESNAGIYLHDATNGNLQVERYTYDPISNTCSIFVYSGIHGNANNFLTQSECDLVCTSA